MLIAYLIVAVVGALGGVSDLISRYKDAPFTVLKNGATVILALVNAIASCLALAIINGSSVVTLPPSLGDGAQTAAQILVAGIGGMAILRVGISIQVSGEVINLSLANLLQPLLRAADNQVDRARAAHKLSVLKGLMFDLDASRTLKELPPLCLYLMNSISQEDQKQLAADVRVLSEADLSDEIKLINLGSTLLNTVGESVLQSAVAAYKAAQVKQNTPVERDAAVPLAQRPENAQTATSEDHTRLLTHPSSARR